ncbi:hypothetical protein GCM10023231_39460 [Olivibacter ginsenosidimutans]|uniref:HTH tetR-type domain-containing protein n=1 Tax=Olivibacter ginsenosidimutans TaxID=1176537 RepID=A0ABP9C7T7_9SPHI
MRNRDENKIERIKQSALEMIVKNGLDAFSIQKLAKTVSVSPATIYIYFRDKEDLILQLYHEVGENMMRETLKGFNPEMHFGEGLRVQWTNRSKYCIQHKNEMIFLEQIRHSSLHEQASAMVNEQFQLAMGEFVRNAISRTEMRPVATEVFWSIAFAPLYNLIRFHERGSSLGRKKFVFSEKIMLETLEIVLKGLKP